MSSHRSVAAKRDSLDLQGLGRRLRELRGFDLTQEQFADELGNQPKPALEVRERACGTGS